MASNFDGIKQQRFGIEIEMTGLTRREAAEVIAGHFGTMFDHYGHYYDKYIVYDPTGRAWTLMSDSSIECTTHNRRSADSEYSVEFVTPICTYDDIPLIQALVRKLREAGAVSNSSTGIHIHIDAAPYDAKHLRNLVNIIASKEDMIYHALRVGEYRERYCEKTDPFFLARLNRQKPKLMEHFERIWYDGPSRSGSHYDSSRYRMLNLHSVFSHGTIEIRAFNSTLHAGVLRAYLTFCLAISNQALTQKSASARPTHSENEKYTFRCWLLRLGLNGDEYKNVRKHLLSHLNGNIAWLHAEDAVAQRERIKQERRAAAEAGSAREPPQAAVLPSESESPAERACEPIFDDDESVAILM